jgi:hypothetical protein
VKFLNSISPRVSKATLRNLDGVMQETRANALEKVTYKWTTHYFEGIQETNLVLEPPQATNRDGILGSNSFFRERISTRRVTGSSGGTNVHDLPHHR